MKIKIISNGTIQYFDYRTKKSVSLNKGDEVEVDDNLLSRMKKGIHYEVIESPIIEPIDPPADPPEITSQEPPQLESLSQTETLLTEPVDLPAEPEKKKKQAKN